MSSNSMFQLFRWVLSLLLLNYLKHFYMEMVKPLISLSKISLKTIGVLLKNGLFSASFGHSVDLFNKLEEKYLTLS